MSSINNTEKDFLGTGWSFPPSFQKSRQSVDMVSAEEDILQSLRILFSTRFGERMMRPMYGSRVASMPFESIDNNQASMIAKQIRNSVSLHEPRITPLNVDVEVDVYQGRVVISMEYQVKATNTRRNFVYPFYIIEGTEVEK